MDRVLIFLAIGVAGCASKPEAKRGAEPVSGSPQEITLKRSSSYPEDAENFLNETQKAQLATLRTASHPLSSRSHFQSDSALRAVYLDWYAKGYTFTAATGLTTRRPQAWMPDSPERPAKLLGWEDGLFDASQKRLKDSFEKLPHR
jgi:hypothetical protein